MSQPFDDILAADLDFINQDVFADSDAIILTDKDGLETAFTAVIDRIPPQIIEGTRDKSAPMFELSISRNILPRKPDKNGDKLTFASQLGDDPTDHPIVEIVSSDGGGHRVRCR